MSLARTPHAQELLDLHQDDPAELERSLRHVAEVNRLLGGNRSVLRALASALGTDGGKILDVGTGSGDLPRHIVRWARGRGTPVSITATDVHPQTLQVARAASAAFPEITIESADALALPYADGEFDIALLCLTLHHFDDAGQRKVLRELARVARRAVIVSELERNSMNYAGARLLAATWWRRNRITRHDGPLSVLRAFTAQELSHVARDAGFPVHRIQRDFFYRLLLVIEPQRSAASRID